jgi:homocysteine S-methyltransferase
MASAEYMATYARRFVAAGVRLVGGCCGTTPDHIRQIATAVRTTVAVPARTSPVPASEASPAEARSAKAEARSAQADPVPRREKSALARAFVDRRFAVVMEVASPRGLDLSPVVAQARRFRSLGAVAVNVPDYPRSGARASAMALAGLVEQQGPVETLLHFTCRDRRLVEMQSDLVGAHAVGLRNLLITTGRPASQGSYPDATAVFDVDAIGLTNMVSRLNHGLDIGGQSIGAPTRFHIGVAVNPFAPNPDAEWKRLAHKVEAGAEFLVTPPILDLAAFEDVLPRLEDTGLPVLAGVVALEGLRHAEFMASEVIGVRVPDALLDRLRQASEERAEAMSATIEIARELAGRVDGLQVTSFHGSSETAEALLEALRPGLLRAEIRPGAAHG